MQSECLAAPLMQLGLGELTKKGFWRVSRSSENELAMPTWVKNISCVELYDV